LRQLRLVVLMKDALSPQAASRNHHPSQVRPLLNEMLVEELVDDAHNGGNVLVPAVVHRCSPIGKLPKRLRVARNEHSPEPPMAGGEVDDW
jgi:hypothetical protein